MIIDYKNFIAGNYIDAVVCDNMITYFENCKYKTRGNVSKENELKTDFSIKKSTDLHIQLHNNDKEIMAYYSELNKVLESYKKLYPYSNTIHGNWAINEDWNIQRYKPNEGFYKWHTERRDLSNSARHLVFMTYLNDVNDGGETEFYHQKLKVKPKKGLTLIWGADWTFVHRGIPSKTETKYIATGWYSYS